MAGAMFVIMLCSRPCPTGSGATCVVKRQPSVGLPASVLPFCAVPSSSLALADCLLSGVYRVCVCACACV